MPRAVTRTGIGNKSNKIKKMREDHTGKKKRAILCGRRVDALQKIARWNGGKFEGVKKIDRSLFHKFPVGLRLLYRKVPGLRLKAGNRSRGLGIGVQGSEKASRFFS